MPIIDANIFRIGETNTSLPNMSATVEGWMQKIIVGIIKKTIQNNRTVETTTNIDTMGTLQPLSAKQLEIKPEGQRGWQWWMLHCQPSLSLRLDDTVTIKGSRYRVMGLWGYSDYGYIQYELVKDYETAIGATV